METVSVLADTCPIDIQNFQGLANDTLPLQSDDSLADLLEDIGLGSTNSSQVVVDLKAFMESLGNRPIYSRLMLRNAANQLPRARCGQDITLMTCSGRIVVLHTKRACLPRYVQLMFLHQPGYL